jgi:hypothetical protein
MLFDYWGNTHYRWATIRPAKDGSSRFAWSTYSKDPGSIKLRPEPLDADDHPPPLKYVLEAPPQQQKTQAAPNQNHHIDWDDCERQVERYVNELTVFTRQLDDMQDLTRRATDDRLALLRGLGVISAIAKATAMDPPKTGPGTAEPDALVKLVNTDGGEDADGIFPKARKFLLGLPVDDSAYHLDDGEQHDTAADAHAYGDHLRFLLFGKNDYTDAVFELSTRVMKDWDLEEQGFTTSPDPKLLALHDKLHTAMAAALVAVGECGFNGRVQGEPFGPQELLALAAKDERAKSEADLQKPSPYAIATSVLGKLAMTGVSVGALSFGNLPGPSSLLVASAQVWGAWKMAKMTKEFFRVTDGIKAGVPFLSPAFQRACEELAYQQLDFLPKNVREFDPLQGMTEQDNLLMFFKEFRANPDRAAALKTLQERQWKVITKTDVLRQNGGLMKSLGAVCQLVATALALASAAQSDETISLPDFLSTIGGVAASGVAAIDAASTVLFELGVDNVVTQFAKVAEVAEFLGKLGNFAGLLCAFAGILAGIDTLSNPDSTKRQQWGAVLGIIGSAGILIVTLCGMAEVGGPVVMTAEVVAIACLIVSGALSLADLEDALTLPLTNQHALAVLDWLRKNREWNEFERKNKDKIEALEKACRGYLPLAPDNADIRDMLSRASVAPAWIDDVCSRNTHPQQRFRK